MPTSGVARRRAKAIARRRWVHDLDSLKALVNGRLPLFWSALTVCPCGFTTWLQPEATPEEHDDFRQSVADHADYCDGGLS